MNQNKVELEFVFIAKFDLSILVHDGVKSMHLPISETEYDTTAERNDIIIVSIPEWLAIEKELI
jgi:hypothetical protein